MKTVTDKQRLLTRLRDELHRTLDARKDAHPNNVQLWMLHESKARELSEFIDQVERGSQ